MATSGAAPNHRPGAFAKVGRDRRPPIARLHPAWQPPIQQGGFDMAEKRTPSTVTRRALLAGGAAAGAAVAVGSGKYGSQLFLLRDAPHSEQLLPQWQDSRVVSYRPLGRAGFAMSDIPFGISGLNDPAVVRRANERGINSFDTSPDSSGAASERALGEGIRGTPREKLFLVHRRRDRLKQIAGHRRSSQGTPTQESREYSEEA
jgi:hypothetical protein